ncbi:agmatinase [bacterium]|nr:agmatinase [bacterium]
MTSAQSAKRVKLLGIPWDEHSSFLRGAADAPRVIRAAFASPSTNTWSEAGIDIGAPSVLQDDGDIYPESGSDPLWEIETAVQERIAGGAPLIVLGGDHTLTWPVIRAFHGRYGQVSILHVDAHPDLYDALDGDRLSHACPFARIMEEGLADRLVQIGIRGMTGHQREQAERFGAEVYDMAALAEPPSLTFTHPLYISFDLDSLDPAFAPGVSHPEPGGLSTREALRLLQGVQAPAIVGADIVEFNPRRDPAGITAAVAAKLCKEIASMMIMCREK